MNTKDYKDKLNTLMERMEETEKKLTEDLGNLSAKKPNKLYSQIKKIRNKQYNLVNSWIDIDEWDKWKEWKENNWKITERKLLIELKNQISSRVNDLKKIKDKNSETNSTDFLLMPKLSDKEDSQIKKILITELDRLRSWLKIIDK